MKKLILTLGSLLLSASLLFTGCGKPAFLQTNTDNSESAVSVYYINESTSGLVADKVELPETSRKNQLKFLIEKLISAPSEKTSPLPSGTKLNSIVIDDDIAIIDFSKEFLDGDNLKQTLAPVAVAKTLCSVDFISGVQILIEGADAVDSDGKPLGIIRESDLVINKDEPTQGTDTSFVLYFANDTFEYLVPERRTIKVASGDTVEKTIVTELINGPKESGHIKTIPSESKLLSIETKNNVCFVNFSKDFIEKHSGGTTAELLTIYSIVNSLTELTTIDKVQFLIEGEKKEEYIHMSFNEPIVRDKSIIKH